MLSLLLSLTLVGAPSSALELCQKLEATKLIEKCRDQASRERWAGNAASWATFEVTEQMKREGSIAVFLDEADLKRAEEFAGDPANEVGPWRFVNNKRLVLVKLSRTVDADAALKVRAAVLAL